MRRLIAAALAVAALLTAVPAYAQGTGKWYWTVANCGTPTGLGLVAGKFGFPTQDTTGKACMAGGGGGDASAANQSTQITAEQAIQATLGAKVDAKSTATDATSVSAMQVLKQISASIQAVAAALAAPISVVQSGPYATGAVPLVATSGNVAAAVAAATLGGAVGKTTYITGFQIAGSGATIGAVVNCTGSGLVGSVTLNYPYAAIAGAVLMNTPIIVSFPTPVPASATNTAIVVSCPSLGTGNTNNSVNAQGFQL